MLALCRTSRRPPASAARRAAAVPAPRMGGDITKRAALSKSVSHLNPAYTALLTVRHSSTVKRATFDTFHDDLRRPVNQASQMEGN